MNKYEFSDIAPKLAEIAIANKLEIEYKPNFNDEMDFVIDLKTEAIDYETFENPTCTELASYLIITMPKVIRDENELRRIAEKEGYVPELDEMIAKYFNITHDLLSVAKPSYMLGVENGHVDKLMWCVWA